MTNDLAELVLQIVLSKAPGLLLPPLCAYRIVRDLSGRFSLQAIISVDGLPDSLPVEVWPGVSGTHSEPTLGEEVVVAFVGVDKEPCIIARSPKDRQAHIPAKVWHEATELIKFVHNSSGEVHVGNGEVMQPVILAQGHVNAMQAIVNGFAAVVAYAQAVAVLYPDTDTAKGALTTAISGISGQIDGFNSVHPTGYLSGKLKAV